MDNVLNYFLSEDLPFAILFAALFIWYIKQSKEREKLQRKHIQELNSIIKSELDKNNRDIELIIELWKTLIQEEIKKRKGVL